MLEVPARLDSLPVVPYPSRPMLEVLPQFRDDTKLWSARSEIERLDEFAAPEYLAGRSLREIAELTGRTQTAIRNSLARTRTPLRARGARPV